MQLSSIQADLYRRLGYATSPDTATVTRLLAYINETQRQILGKRFFQPLREAVLPAQTIANIKYLALPQAATRVYNIVDPSNSHDLEQWSLSKLRALDPGESTTGGFPRAFAIVDLNGAVSRQPSDASQLWLKSSSAADTGATFTVFVEGVTSDGFHRTTNVDLTGTTAVQLGSLATWIWIKKLYIETAPAGDVSLLEDSGTGTTLSIIPAGKTVARYSLVRLYPVPGSAVDLEVDCELAVLDMSNATDESLIPDQYAHILGIGARLKEYERREKLALWREAKREYSEVYGDLLGYVHQIGGTTDPAGKGKRYSQLGPWYPAGS